MLAQNSKKSDEKEAQKTTVAEASRQKVKEGDRPFAANKGQENACARKRFLLIKKVRSAYASYFAV
jgi:hypothetical protein